MTHQPPANDATHSLPDRPNLEQLKKQAKRLLSEYRQGEPSAEQLVAQFERQPDREAFGLQDAQRVLARSYGFASWTRLKERVAIAAIKNGDTENLQSIITQSSDVDKLLATKISDADPTGYSFGKEATLLQFASFRSWKGDTTSTLIQSGAVIDLHSACGLGNVEVIERTLQANPAAIGEQVDSYFPIQYAIAACQVDALECLLRNGDDPNRSIKKVGWFDWEDQALSLGQAPWQPIHMAALWGFDKRRVETAKTLHDAGADLNADSPLDGYRPIHLAAMPCRVDMVRFLVSVGIDVDSRTTARPTVDVPDAKLDTPHGGHDWTPLMVACGEGFTEMVELLLELGADVSARNSMGRTPLHIAAGGFWKDRQDIYAQIVRLLLQRGADSTAADAEGKLPVDFAQLKGYEQNVALLNSST